MPRGARTRLFHAVVGLGFAACGGLTTAASKDAGSDATPNDADASGGTIDTGIAFYDASVFRDAASAEAAVDAADASADADADAFIVTIQ